MKTTQRIIVASVAMMGFCDTAFANDVPWNRELAYPVAMTAEQIALADWELLPENVNRKFDALASDHGQKFEEKSGEEPTPYFEVTSTTKRGKDPADSFSGIGFYTEFPFDKDGLSLWLSGYKDPGFSAGYIGLAKKSGNLQWAIGGAEATYGGKRHFVANPWVSYSSDEYEALLLVERYSNEEDNPIWYKWSVEKKLGPWSLGVYGDKGFGIGPLVTYKISDNVKLWLTVPVANLPNEGRMAFMAKLIFSF